MAESPDLKWIVLDCRGVDTIDATAVEGLENLLAAYRSRGIRILLAHAKLPIRERLKRVGWEEKFGQIASYPPPGTPSGP